MMMMMMMMTLHDQLASLDTHAQLTHCFSAVAELLVKSGHFSVRKFFIGVHVWTSFCRKSICRIQFWGCICFPCL